ncbi:hypothetical protein P7C71_g431, partial [Lecanoromycetidae sp. Uapishka_2]
MSPRTDSYLSLCLEQAAHSSLHYRHGAIIVRGGKVIGQGHNDYRPGFNGGLKTGKSANGASSSSAILGIKQKSKSKQKLKQSDQDKTPSLVELSSMDSNDLSGGSLVNSPLSMHSEMSAIQAALSLSGNTASYGSARSSSLMQKPGSFALPGRGKRELRLQNLKDYVETRQQGFNAEKEEEKEEKTEDARTGTRSDNSAFLVPSSTKCARSSVAPQKPAAKRKTSDPTPTRDHLKSSPTILVPQGITRASSHKVEDRAKDSRIKGSDLYVARLCWKTAESHDPPLKQAGSLVKSGTAEAYVVQEDVNSTHADDGPTATPRIRSLHDELQFCGAQVTADKGQCLSSQKKPMATQSRPCYRCISYMHFAGVKRVFWTNAKGEWEGAKVRELVDALESSQKGVVGGDVETLFVTKHEVLMLKRAMGL